MKKLMDNFDVRFELVADFPLPVAKCRICGGESEPQKSQTKLKVWCSEHKKTHKAKPTKKAEGISYSKLIRDFIEKAEKAVKTKDIKDRYAVKQAGIAVFLQSYLEKVPNDWKYTHRAGEDGGGTS